MTVLERLAAQSKPQINSGGPRGINSEGNSTPNSEPDPSRDPLPKSAKGAEMALAVRRDTQNGATLRAYLLEVAAGLTPLPVREVDPETGEERIRVGYGTPTAGDRLKAIGMLKLWGWGREPEHVNVDVKAEIGPAFDVERLSPEDLQGYLGIMRKARGEPAIEGKVTVLQLEKTEENQADASTK